MLELKVSLIAINILVIIISTFFLGAGWGQRKK